MSLFHVGGPPLWFLRVGRDQAAGGSATIVPPPSVIQWIRCAAASTAGSTAIKVDILSAGLPSGSTLNWSGGARAVTASNTAAGASQISLASLSAAVAAGETATGSVNARYLRQVLVTMPAPTISAGRPTN